MAVVRHFLVFGSFQSLTVLSRGPLDSTLTVRPDVTFDDSISSDFDEHRSKRISVPRSVFPSSLLFALVGRCFFLRF